MAKSEENSIFGYLQKLGKSLFLPISLLPIAGLLLGLGASFTNESTIAAYHLESFLGDGTILNGFLSVMNQVGNVILANLPLLFAMAIALGMAKNEKAVAVLASAIAFLVMHTTIGAMLVLSGKVMADGSLAEGMAEGLITSVLGIKTLQMGVFSGIIVGIGVSMLHNRFYKQKLPDVLAFFSGTRFVPIISVLVYIFVGILASIVWPVVQSGIYALGNLIRESGYFGTFLYGAVERLLIPFGLHHILNVSFWQTAIGGSAVVDGIQVLGSQNIFFAELASPNVTQFSLAGTRFTAGKYAFMIAGLPAACLAMYRTAKPENRKVIGGMLLSAALTSIITGVTEPIEFTFLFVAPMLYGIHAVLGGLAFVIFQLLHITIGQTFSCGLIDFLLYGVLPGQAKSNWMMSIPVLAAYAVLYYGIFRFCIQKFNLPTPGREEGENKLYTKEDYKNKGNSSDTESEQIVLGLGGLANIVEVDNCATRLRVILKDCSLVKDEILKATGSRGVVKKGNGVQVIYGTRVSIIKSELVEYMQN